MKLINKLKTDRKFLLIVSSLVVASFFVPYLTLPFAFLWWFLKTSKFSRKFKIITMSSLGGLFAVLIGWFGIAYATDAQPHLTITQPALTTNIKSPEITIAGRYSPSDRVVQVNGQDITAKNGSFQLVYKLNVGENKIDIQAGNLRWAHVYLMVNRELTNAEKAKLITPTPTTKPTSQPTQPSVKTDSTKPTIIPTATPTSIPALSVSEKAQVVVIITANTDHFKQLWSDGQTALGTTQYDAYSGLDALNDPNSNAYKFSQYKQKENPANDNSMNDALTQADKFYPSNVSDDALNKWRLDMIQLSSDMGLWVNDATSWQIQEATTAKLNNDAQTVENDFITVEQDIQAIH